jgi:hypothetical protein
LIDSPEIQPQGFPCQASAPVEFQGDVGYGDNAPGFYRGALVTMKKVIAADGQCEKARRQMEGGRTPY